jgi:hypothetical protein
MLQQLCRFQSFLMSEKRKELSISMYYAEFLSNAVNNSASCDRGKRGKEYQVSVLSVPFQTILECSDNFSDIPQHSFMKTYCAVIRRRQRDPQIRDANGRNCANYCWKQERISYQTTTSKLWIFVCTEKSENTVVGTCQAHHVAPSFRRSWH